MTSRFSISPRIGVCFLLVLLLVLSCYISASAQVGTVTTFAGNGTATLLDGIGTTAQFSDPYGVTADGAGNLYVADAGNNCIRKIVIATGVVTTLAGDGSPGFIDGTGVGSQFNYPHAVATDGSGNLFVADRNNQRIRKIVIATGVVTTLAGNGAAGFLDGTGTSAQFNNPTGICCDGAGSLYVADFSNSRIRKIIIATGVVTTLAGGVQGFLNGTGAAAQFNRPFGIAADGIGNLYVADFFNHRIRKIVIATGVVTTLAGSTSGFADGIGVAAQFSFPSSVTTDGLGNLYVTSDSRIRKITLSAGAVSTVAGDGTFSFADGTGIFAQFLDCNGIAIDAMGTLYTADRGNNRIRKINLTSTSVAISGSTFPEATTNDGSFAQTCDITITGDTWVPVGAFTAGTDFVATGVPVGLTITVNRISPTIARVSFIGNATTHTNANDATFALRFTNAAFSFGIASAVMIADANDFAGGTPTSYTIDFNDPSSAAYAGTTFPEAAANNGTITQTRDITLTGDTWVPIGAFVNPADFTATGIPTGLAIAVNRISSTVARISFSGTAIAHASVNDATLTLNFANTAVAGGNSSGITGLNAASLTVDFSDQPAAAYSAVTFSEAVANNGSVTATQTITLTSETWNSGITNGTNFTAGIHYTVANVPTGLTMVIQKTSSGVATVSFTGSAAAHAAANSVANVQITWLAAATQSVAPVNFTGLNGVNLSINFINPGGVVWSGSIFGEAAANNGAITATHTISLTTDSWQTGVANGMLLTSGVHYTVANVPTGLTMIITKNSATQVTVSFTGNASVHANANDVANVQITFLNAAVNSGNANGNAGLNGVLFTLDFNDPVTALFSGVGFSEAAANDGSITNTQIITLTGDVFLPLALSAGTDYTVANVPLGLTCVVTKTSANTANISFSGNAAAHTAAASVANVQITFANAAFGSGNAAAITGLNGQNLSITFLNSLLPPTITSFNPANGFPGSTVMLTGSGFTGATAVSFGGIPAASFTVNSDTQITAVIGGGTTVIGGTQLVIVSAPGGSGLRGGFFIGSPVSGASPAVSGVGGTPTGTIVTRIEPSAFTFGTSVIVRGAGFSGTTGLTLGGSAVTNFVVLNDNTISCVVGAVPTSDHIVVSGSILNTSVTTFGGIGASYFRQPAPSIVSLNPASVVASDDDVPLTLTGSNLNQGAVASSQAHSAGGVSIAVPVQTFSGAVRSVLTFPGAARTVGIKTITLTNPDGQFASVTLAVTPAPAPMLTSDALITTNATGRAFTVSLAGTGFFKGARVVADGQPLVNVRTVSAARILAEIPAEANQVDISQTSSNQVMMNQSFRAVRLQIVNSDGQSTTATLQIIRRPLPYITQVLTTRVFDGNAAMWELRIRGGNFMGGIVAQLSSEMLRVRSQAADTLIVARTRGDFRCTTTTASLIVTNPDGAAHGILLAQQLFDPLKSGASFTDASAPSVVSEAESESAPGTIRIAPNPLTETLQLQSPEAPELVRLVNMLGVVVLESRERTVDVRSLPSGVYAVEITLPAGKRSMLRVVKQ